MTTLYNKQQYKNYFDSIFHKMKYIKKKHKHYQTIRDIIFFSLCLGIEQYEKYLERSAMSNISQTIINRYNQFKWRNSLYELKVADIIDLNRRLYFENFGEHMSIVNVVYYLNIQWIIFDPYYNHDIVCSKDYIKKCGCGIKLKRSWFHCKGYVHDFMKCVITSKEIKWLIQPTYYCPTRNTETGLSKLEKYTIPCKVEQYTRGTIFDMFYWSNINRQQIAFIKHDLIENCHYFEYKKQFHDILSESIKVRFEKNELELMDNNQVILYLTIKDYFMKFVKQKKRTCLRIFNRFMNEYINYVDYKLQNINWPQKCMTFLSADHTYHFASKCSDAEVKFFRSTYFIKNAHNYIVACKMCCSDRYEEVNDLYLELAKDQRYMIELVVVDNCCKESGLAKAFSDYQCVVKIKLDVFHLLNRFMKAYPKNKSTQKHYHKMLDLIKAVIMKVHKEKYKRGTTYSLEQQKKLFTALERNLKNCTDENNTLYKLWKSNNFKTAFYNFKKHIYNGCLCDLEYNQNTSRNEIMHKYLKLSVSKIKSAGLKYMAFKLYAYIDRHNNNIKYHDFTKNVTHENVWKNGKSFYKYLLEQEIKEKEKLNNNNSQLTNNELEVTNNNPQSTNNNSESSENDSDIESIDSDISDKNTTQNKNDNSINNAIQNISSKLMIFNTKKGIIDDKNYELIMPHSKEIKQILNFKWSLNKHINQKYIFNQSKFFQNISKKVVKFYYGQYVYKHKIIKDKKEMISQSNLDDCLNTFLDNDMINSLILLKNCVSIDNIYETLSLNEEVKNIENLHKFTKYGLLLLNIHELMDDSYYSGFNYICTYEQLKKTAALYRQDELILNRIMIICVVNNKYILIQKELYFKPKKFVEDSVSYQLQHNIYTLTQLNYSCIVQHLTMQYFVYLFICDKKVQIYDNEILISLGNFFMQHYNGYHLFTETEEKYLKKIYHLYKNTLLSCKRTFAQMNSS